MQLEDVVDISFKHFTSSVNLLSIVAEVITLCVFKQVTQTVLCSIIEGGSDLRKNN